MLMPLYVLLHKYVLYRNSTLFFYLLHQPLYF